MPHSFRTNRTALFIGLSAVIISASSPVSALTYSDFSDTSGLTFSDSATTTGNSLDLNAAFDDGAVWATQKQSVGSGFQTSYTLTVGPSTSEFAADLLAFVVQTAAVDATIQGGHPATVISTNFVGIYLDTFLNTNIPVHDTSNWHLDIISFDGAGTRTDTILNVDILGVKDTNQHQVDINYDALNTNLQVFFDSILYIDIDYDLSSEITLDNGTAWVGFAGAGNSNETHFVNSWSFIPEPSTALLMGFGLVGLGVRRRG